MNPQCETELLKARIEGMNCRRKLDHDAMTVSAEEIKSLRAQLQESGERVRELEDTMNWAMGRTNFRGRKEGEGKYWWRSELRERAKMIYNPDTLKYEALQGKGKQKKENDNG